MATATQPKTAIVGRSARQEVEVDVSMPSRREFMYYIWGASMVMLLGQTTAGIIWFSLPRFREGEFGGIFRYNPGEVPPQGGIPVNVATGRFWVSNTDNGLLALYAICTHLGCLPKWQASTDRYECPCHGSKFERTGQYIAGPAPRGLDRFSVTVTFDDGSTAATPSGGGAIPIAGRNVVDIAVDTGNRILGPSRGT